MEQDNGVARVIQQLRRALNDSLTLVNYTQFTYSHTRVWLSNQLASAPEENPDPMFYFGEEPPDDPASTVVARDRLSNLIRSSTKGGRFSTLLGQQWVVSFYALWDEVYRPALAAAHGCPTNSIKAPLLGDLRLLRHDVVHKKGIATAEHCGRCTTLTWFAPGQPIELTSKHYTDFVRRFPWEQLKTPPANLDAAQR